MLVLSEDDALELIKDGHLAVTGRVLELPLIVIYEYVRAAGFMLNAPRLKLGLDSRATKEVSQAAFYVIRGCSQSDVVFWRSVDLTGNQTAGQVRARHARFGAVSI